MDSFYHPITTNSKEAQDAFNKGLLAIYAFNYDESVRNFDLASQYDPNCAMAYWGMALALDETLDKAVTPIHAQLTWFLYKKAESLSDQVTPNEKAYIQALKDRFSEDPKQDKSKLRVAFKDAMSKVVSSFPDDLDATVLYAESIMDVLSWHLWNADKSPIKGTEEILQLLESVLIKNPLHPGANHYYIHAVEDSKEPERGLISAYRLDALNFSEWGHLLHTSSHIYMRVGSYERAVNANKKAVQADYAYIKEHGIEGKYPLKYLSHNLYFLTIAYAWQERHDEAVWTAKELERLVFAHVADAPMLEYNLIMPMQVYLYFHDWEKILNIPEPEAKYEIVKLFWMFARAVAFAATNNSDQMTKAKDLFMKQKEWMFEKRPAGVKSMKETFDLAELVLLSEIAKVEGKLEEAIGYLKQAVQKQDQEESVAWFNPLSQSLGALLLQANKPAEAEAVFRKGLDLVPRNGRLLFGLSLSLNKQKKFSYWVEREKKAALKYSSSNLKLRDL